jgi:putative membrane protein
VSDRLIFDPGLQPERTALAWRRTALSMGVGSLAALRILPALFGAWAIAPAAIAVAFSIVILIAAERRYRRDHAALLNSASDRIPLSGGALPALMAAVTLGIGLVAAGVLFVH